MFRYLREKFRRLVRLVLEGHVLITNIEISPVDAPQFPDLERGTGSYDIVNKKMKTTDKVRLLDYLDEQARLLDLKQLPDFDTHELKQADLQQIDSSLVYQPGDRGFVMK